MNNKEQHMKSVSVYPIIYVIRCPLIHEYAVLFPLFFNFVK